MSIFTNERQPDTPPTAIVIKMTSDAGPITFVVDNDTITQLDRMGIHTTKFADHHRAMVNLWDNTQVVIRDMQGRFVP